MTLKSIRIILFVLVALFLAACGGEGVDVSFSTANISSATLAKDEAGTQKTTTFAPEDTFYLIIDLANAPEDTTVRADWMAVDVANTDPNTKIDDVELTSGSSTLTFDLANEGVWPVGEYKVDLYLNDELKQTLTFNVVGGLGDSAEPTEVAVVEEPTAVPEPTEAPTEEPAVSGAVRGIENIRNAIIQIEAEGSFVDPEFGQQYNAAGRGSGFIIDPSGIAVTNNHVVTGAALVKVYLAGENQPRNARILGVSECSDLAVIDIDGEGFSYLEWYEGDINVGMDMYVAGFPLGDPEYTLTRGIISKANADGETNWASVDAVVEYDANTNPGNSGGPVLTPDAEVLAVHYAGFSAARQAFGISSAVARPIVDRLRQGEDVHSIGINGQAILTEDGLSGMWVSSVKSGSPASEAGVRGGDIITRLEGLVLSTDGTMADYCDILRSHDPSDVLAIEVLRFASQEVLEGQLNGRELELSFSFAEEIEENTDAAPAASGTSYSGYVQLTDDSGTMAVEVPAEWSQTDGSAWVNDSGETLGVSLVAAPDIEGFLGSWSMPGMRMRASSSLGVGTGEALDTFDYSSECTYDGRAEYADAVYSGFYDIWIDCGSTDSTYIIVAAAPADNSHLVVVEVQLITDADVEALDRILQSFIVTS